MKIENRKIIANETNEYIRRKYDEMVTSNLFKMVSLGINENESNFTSVIVTEEEYNKMIENEMKEGEA